jgi:enamine deaminase RidA (YjgF/YER057c/UK114 family)
VFKNLKAAVEAAGGDFNDVIKLNFYCSESVDPALFLRSGEFEINT